jgi:NTP pyrophosphatase (non-canonical NTP hydrolase)
MHIIGHSISKASFPVKQVVSLRPMMNQYRDETMIMCRRKGWDKAPVSTVWLLFTEEVGELASAIRQYQRSYKKSGLKKDRGTDVTQEMGDVFSYLFQLASMLDVDLDYMWTIHKEKVQNKVYKENIRVC